MLDHFPTARAPGRYGRQCWPSVNKTNQPRGTGRAYPDALADIARHSSPVWLQLVRQSHSSTSPWNVPMTASAVLALVAIAAGADTARASAPDSVGGPVQASLASTMLAPGDTVRRRRRAIEVSDWYERRLRIHRYGSYVTYPLFALTAVAGTQLYDDPRNGAPWAKNSMRYGATALATVFTSNTVTGLWNLWDSRNVSKGRTPRALHALLMLASDAGFSYAGSRLAEQAENSVDKRREHRTWAYGSMATALTGIAIIKYWSQE